MTFRVVKPTLTRRRRAHPGTEALLLRDIQTYRTTRERAELAAILERHDGGHLHDRMGSAVIGVQPAECPRRRRRARRL